MAKEKPIKKEKITDEIATAKRDIDIYAGWLTRLENPDPVVLNRGGGKGLKLYDEVGRDDQAGSVLETRYLAVSGLEFSVTPAGGKNATDAQIEQAEFVRETFLSCNFSQAMQELMRGLLYGFYVAEVMWQVVDSAITIKKFITKHPRRFVFTPERVLRLLTHGNYIDGEAVPDRKFVVFTWGDSDNPYGNGLGQRLWWPVWFKKHGIKFWSVFLEKFASPTVVGKYPPGTPKEQQDDLLDAIDSLQNDTGIKVPADMEVMLLEAARRGESFDQFCERMDKAIAKTVLGQVGTSEGTPGQLGDGKEHQEVRADRLKADADLLAETLNSTVVRWLVELNYPDVTEFPKLWFEAEKGENLTEAMNRDKVATVDIGLPVPKAYFYEKYNYPQPEEGQETVGGQTAATAPSPFFAETQNRLLPAQNAVDSLADDVAQKAADALKNNEQAIVKAVQGSASFEEAFVKVLELYPDMDFGSFVTLMDQAAFAGQVFGVSTVQQEN